MKIRNGFVSNSSSSSFCIYGCEIDNKEYEKIEDNDVLSKFKNISTHATEYECYIGRDFTSIKDDETGKQFKESTQRDIDEILGEHKKLYAIEQAWYNG